ncbi:hypothetical protein SSS_03441 [Sarcoptes scabiei]|uniref:Atlastin-2 n=1 Tax=Sarcoptes scabiei TaxID=52283 RepID=A0A834R1N5_SARSC|nr:hypothetical protein SSS_03441 [Sarcoptes scabiei]
MSEKNNQYDLLSEPNGGSSSSSTSEYELLSNPDQGFPVQIVKVTEDRLFELDVPALESILLRETIRDVPVVIVSIAGDFRKGKSFMLNHFLRYLKSGLSGDDSKIFQPDDWLSDEKAPLKGFSWRGGCQRDTTGILMWSEPFLIQTSPDERVAVILMDTQGAFDSEYTVKDSATIFALSTMTSSIQVFNLMHNLQEDNLQVLEVFLEYGRLALESTPQKPFRKLVFLIRDWSYPYEHSYGFEGGVKLLEKKLELKETMPEQLQRVRRKIRDCFEEVTCFLMPHPGSKVATSQEFDGRIQDYDPSFLEYLKKFVPNLLEPKNLVPKEIGGRSVTGKQMLEYFKVYINVFAGDSMPEPKTMLEATAEANNLTAVALIKEMYDTKMEMICGGTQPYINPNTLESNHKDLMQFCLNEFDSIPKMGGSEYSVSYRENLEQQLEQAFEYYAAHNKSKNIFGVFGTPLILLCACFICFITGRMIELIGLQKVADLLVSIGTIDLALLIAYVVGRYSGNYPGFVSMIDYISEEIWVFGMDMLQNFIQTQTIGTITEGNLNSTAISNRTLNRTLSTNQTSTKSISNLTTNTLSSKSSSSSSSSSSSAATSSSSLDFQKRNVKMN